jgi:hypothetical protein
LETFLFFEESEQRDGLATIYVAFAHTEETGAIMGCAESGYLLIGSRSLFAKLVAGEIQNLKSLSMIMLIHRLQCLILRGEATLCSRIDN